MNPHIATFDPLRLQRQREHAIRKLQRYQRRGYPPPTVIWWIGTICTGVGAGLVLTALVLWR